MWSCEDAEDVKMRRWCVDVKMRGCEGEKMICVDVKKRGCEGEKMTCVDVKMRGCEDEKMICVDEKMWRCENVSQTPTIRRILGSDALGKKKLDVSENGSATIGTM